MCGLTGFLSPGWSGDPAAAAAILDAMGGAIRHRGPDSSGRWFDRETGLGFAHARLAIVDLSPAGAQPMLSPSERFVFAYNGEIYNHMDLRRELEEAGHAPNWKGHSDTETLLAGIEAWGVARTLERTIGMFAFALWDRRERELVLARDRLGEKPLYFGWQGAGADRAFLFGSELKALAQHPSFAGEIDRDAVVLLMRSGYIGGGHSVYRGIDKLPPGTCLTLSAGAAQPRLERYWSAAEAVRAGVANRLEVDGREAVDRLEALLADAVGKQMMSDVPLGAFLSGGIDSSTIVALMQAQASRPVRTFSIGFHASEFNEAEHAKAVARHLGTDHTELYLTPEDALDVIPQLSAVYDEPFADVSQIPTLLVCEMARRHVTVALSGDGGDELFGGYGRYHNAAAFWRRIGSIPESLRPALGRLLKLVPPAAWTKLGRASPLAGPSTDFSSFGQLVHKAADVLRARSPGQLYRDMSSHWLEPERIVIGGRQPAPSDEPDSADAKMDSVETMMAIDLQTYLTDDILAKVDRAAMSVSLETRVPLLDHRVVEFSWKLPPDIKFGPAPKWPLRQLLYRHVPKELVERPKKGFNVPLHAWLRGPLRPWAEELLDEGRLRREGFLNAGPIRAAWKRHLRGDLNLHFPLWNVLMFQSWLAARA